MNSSSELYNRLIGTLSALVSARNIAEVKNWIWIVLGILQSESIALSKIATYIPGETQAESRFTMIRRWLMNFHVDVWSFYKPVLEHALIDWKDEVANIILDGVMVGGDRWQILRLSLAHGQNYWQSYQTNMLVEIGCANTVFGWMCNIRFNIYFLLHDICHLFQRV
jgi:hypothetical protein